MTTDRRNGNGNVAPSPLLIVILAPFLSFALPPSLHIPPLLITPLISPLCFTFVLLVCPFLSPTICLSNMAVPSQLGAFPENKTSNAVPPQFCFCHSCYMRSAAEQREWKEKCQRAQKPVCLMSLNNWIRVKSHFFKHLWSSTLSFILFTLMERNI